MLCDLNSSATASRCPRLFETGRKKMNFRWLIGQGVFPEFPAQIKWTVLSGQLVWQDLARAVSPALSWNTIFSLHNCNCHITTPVTVRWRTELPASHTHTLVRSRGGGVTQVKTYVNMRVRNVFKWTHISEIHGRRIWASLRKRHPFLRISGHSC